jgi:hypothetical protein
MPQLICNDAKRIVEQQQTLFATLWDKATLAEQKIGEVEE